jgi:beta-glucosidase
MDPVLLGRYPEHGLAAYADKAPQVRAGDLELINQPLDFVGINTYSGECVRAGHDGRPEDVPWDPGFRMTTFRWPVAPAALYWAPRFIHERYRVPIYITENGMANTDWVALDGRVHDPQRIDFIQRYLRQLRKAVQDGVDVRGYFYWSILDNFEWAEGYKERFGLVYVDYQTQVRTLKDSAYWYAAVIASKGANLDTPYTYPIPPAAPAKEREKRSTDVGEDRITVV